MRTATRPGVSGSAPGQPGRMVTPEMVRVVSAVRRLLRVEPEDMLGNSRWRQATYARHLAMYLLREDHGYSCVAIGRAFGRDRATASEAVRRIGRQLLWDPSVRLQVAAVRRALA